VTLKTGVMAAENSNVPSQNITFQNIFKFMLFFFLNVIVHITVFTTFLLKGLGEHKRLLQNF